LVFFVLVIHTTSMGKSTIANHVSRQMKSQRENSMLHEDRSAPDRVQRPRLGLGAPAETNPKLNGSHGRNAMRFAGAATAHHPIE
jgi:hypothetical protein